MESDVISDSDDNFENDELWTIHLRQEHKNSGIFLGRRGRRDENLSDDEIDNMKGYVLFVKLYCMYYIVCTFIMLGNAGSLGPWRRVMVHLRKPLLCQNDPHIGGSFWHSEGFLRCTMTLL